MTAFKIRWISWMPFVVLAAFASCVDGDGNCTKCDVSCRTCDAGCLGADLPDATSDSASDAGVDMQADVADDGTGDVAAEILPDVIQDDGPHVPTYWTAEATKPVDDLVFVTHKGKRVFGLGIHPGRNGGWDGITGANGCHCDQATQTCVGLTNDGIQQTHAAAQAGANFAYTWGYDRDPEYLKVDPPFLGVWHSEYGQLDQQYGPGTEAIPVMACEYGETDMDGFNPANVQKMKDDFEAFKTRSGRWSKEAMPNLPSYEDMPWFCWHPTFRMRGGGDGNGEAFTDDQVEVYAKATNMLIGDTYSYVCNRFEGIEAIIMGQDGQKGECYDDWLARDDPAHRSYFEAGWALAHSLRLHANPDACVWMWMQGHAFDDDIGGATCWNGSSDLWASGPFPTDRYLRKEIMSTAVAGGTGFIYFGYGYGRDTTSSRARNLIRALAWEEVYEPALLSPRLDMEQDLTFTGEGGRAHLMAKWDATTRTAYLLGANPGASVTPFEVTFPWSIAGVDLLDWWTPAWIEDPAVHGVQIADRTIRWTAPQDDGFIIRVRPLFAPEP
jgi:hypothetical protein